MSETEPARRGGPPQRASKVLKQTSNTRSKRELTVSGGSVSDLHAEVEDGTTVTGDTEASTEPASNQYESHMSKRRRPSIGQPQNQNPARKNVRARIPTGTEPKGQTASNPRDKAVPIHRPGARGSRVLVDRKKSAKHASRNLPRSRKSSIDLGQLTESDSSAGVAVDSATARKKVKRSRAGAARARRMSRDDQVMEAERDPFAESDALALQCALEDANSGGSTIFRGRPMIDATTRKRERKQKHQHVVRAIQVREEFLRRISVLAKKFDDTVTHCRATYDHRKPQSKRTLQLLADTRTRLTKSFVRLRELTSHVVERMNEWQDTLKTPAPFLWNGQSYCKKVLDDFAYLDDMKSFRMWVGFSLARNPFVLSPEQLGYADAQSLGIVKHSFPPFTQNLRDGPYSFILGKSRFVPPPTSSPAELLQYCEALSYLLFEEEMVAAQHQSDAQVESEPEPQKQQSRSSSALSFKTSDSNTPSSTDLKSKHHTKPKPFARDLGLKRTRHRLRREFLKGVTLMGQKYLVTIEMDRERHQFLISAEKLKTSEISLGNQHDAFGRKKSRENNENEPPVRLSLKLERIEVAAFLTQVSAGEFKACGISGVRAEGLTPVIGSLDYGSKLLTRLKTTPLCEYLCSKLELVEGANDSGLPDLALKFLV